MLYGTGLTEEDMKLPQVGIASMGWDGNPCNMHLNSLAQKVKESMSEAELVGLVFHTIGVSDGISMGTEGMKFSLPSRDIIADSIETVVRAQWYDACVCVAGCDKNMPGCMMAIARLNVPSIFVYGGTILAGNYLGEDVNIQDVFEAVGAYASGDMTLDQLHDLECAACPGEGSCAGLFTANTMSTAIEVMGMSLPGDASIPATDPRKKAETEANSP